MKLCCKICEPWSDVNRKHFTQKYKILYSTQVQLRYKYMSYNLEMIKIKQRLIQFHFHSIDL